MKIVSLAAAIMLVARASIAFAGLPSGAVPFHVWCGMTAKGGGYTTDPKTGQTVADPSGAASGGFAMQPCSQDGNMAVTVGGTRVTTPMPYIVPSNKRPCIQHFLLVNKFPWQPYRWDLTMHHMYALINGMTVVSHHPEENWYDNPLDFWGPGYSFEIWIINGMAEDQNIYVTVDGYLMPSGQSCQG